MALEIQLQLQGDTRTLLEADLVEGEIGYNTDSKFQELMYHVKNNPGTFKHFPSLEKLASTLKTNTSGAQLIGFDSSQIQTLSATNVQEALEQFDGALAVSGSGASVFIDQYESIQATGDMVGLAASWTDTGGWSSTVDGEFSFADGGGDGTTINANPGVGAGSNDEFSPNTWYGITYTATNGGTPTTATFQMKASQLAADATAFVLPTADGTYTVFFRSGTSGQGFIIETTSTGAGIGSIVLSNVTIGRANFQQGSSSRYNAVNGDINFSGHSTSFRNMVSGADFTIERTSGLGMSLQGNVSGAVVTAGKDIWVDSYSATNNSFGGNSLAGQFKVEGNEAWGAGARGSRMVWSVVIDGDVNPSELLSLTGKNNGELQLDTFVRLRFGDNTTAIGAETITHYMPAVDLGGNLVKLAVLT